MDGEQIHRGSTSQNPTASQQSEPHLGGGVEAEDASIPYVSPKYSHALVAALVLNRSLRHASDGGGGDETRTQGVRAESVYIFSNRFGVLFHDVGDDLIGKPRGSHRSVLSDATEKGTASKL